MILKGTKNLAAGEVAGAIEEKGGRINAYTSFENTVYHATLSARHWEEALEVLTDAVLNSVFDAEELKREKLVVLEEIGMRNDRPQIKMFQEMMSNSYTTHPYRLPVIGSVESVSSFTRDDIVQYMKEHYCPENFTVVVVGGVRAPEVLDKVEGLFGNLPAKKPKVNGLPVEPPQKEARFFQLEDDINQAQLAMALPIPAFSHDDSAVLDVISSIMGQGESSRLYHQLRNKKGLVYQINCSAFTPKYPGLLEVAAVLDESKIAPAIEAALTELFKLKYIKVEADELARVKHNQESDFIFNLERVEGQARVMGAFFIQTGDPREDDYLDRVRSVSPEDIMRVAKEYLQGEKLTAGYLSPRGAKVGLDKDELLRIIERAEIAAKNSIPTSLINNSYLDNLHSFKLKNGMKLLVREDPQVPVVAVRAIFQGGLRAEDQANNGAFAFISNLLSRSTEKMTARELSLKLADMAGDISGYNGKNTFGLKADFLSKFFEEGLGLFRDVMLTPAFDPAEAEKIRPELLASLKQQEDSLPSLSFKEFNRILFQSHPYSLNTMGSAEVINSLSASDMQALYKKHATPGNLVLSIVGDVKAEEVKKEVDKLFGSWQGETQAASEDFLAPEPPAEPIVHNIVREKEQVHIIIGFLGSTMSSKDRFAIEVLESVLNGQSGRLFRQLRDQQSLAYSLSCFSWPGLDTGAFGVHIGTSPDKKEEAIKSVWQELYKVREELVTDEELEKAKNVLIGHYELGLETHGLQAMDVALMETYDLGQDFGKKYIEEIGQISKEDVRKIAMKYIQPDHYVLVTVGAE